MLIALVLIALVLIIKWVKHSSRIVFRALGLKISTSWEKYHRRVCSVCCFFHLCKPAKFVTWTVRIIFRKFDNKLWIISLEKEYFDGKESVRFLCLQTFTRLRLRLLVVYKAKDSWALTRLERLLLLHLTLLLCDSHQIQIVALRFSLNTNCCLAILTKYKLLPCDSH